MHEITVYTSSTCPYCTLAKNHLTEKGVSYVEKNVSTDKEELRAALVRAGIEETVRGEDLALDDYVRLARELPKL